MTSLQALETEGSAASFVGLIPVSWVVTVELLDNKQSVAPVLTQNYRQYLLSKTQTY